MNFLCKSIGYAKRTANQGLGRSLSASTSKQCRSLRSSGDFTEIDANHSVNSKDWTKFYHDLVSKINTEGLSSVEDRFRPLKSIKPKGEIVRKSHFIDFANLEVTAGNGGDGCISLASEYLIEFAGPDGADGGNGGHIFFKSVSGLKSLYHIKPRQSSESGKPGKKRQCIGKSAPPLIIEIYAVGDSFSEVLMAKLKNKFPRAMYHESAFISMNADVMRKKIALAIKDNPPPIQVIFICSIFLDSHFKQSVKCDSDGKIYKYTSYKIYFNEDMLRKERVEVVQVRQMILDFKIAVQEKKVADRVSLVIVLPTPIDLFQNFRFNLVQKKAPPMTADNLHLHPYSVILPILKDNMGLHFDLMDRLQEVARRERIEAATHEGKGYYVEFVSYFELSDDGSGINPLHRLIDNINIVLGKENCFDWGITDEEGIFPSHHIVREKFHQWERIFDRVGAGNPPSSQSSESSVSLVSVSLEEIRRREG